MVHNVHIVIVVVTITVLWTLVFFPTNIFSQSGDLYIHIRGTSLGDNLKVSVQTDQYSWEWREIPSYGN